MRKSLNFGFILLLLILNSCSKFKEKEEIIEFIFLSYSGFNFLDKEEYLVDSTQLNIRYYIEYKKDEFVRITNHKRWNDSTHYYAVRPVDTFGLGQMLNYSFIGKNYKHEYINIEGLYDGFFYIIYYKTSSGEKHFIDFLPDDLPSELKPINNFCENILRGTERIESKKFKYHPILKEKALSLYQNHPPPPEVLEQKVEFKAPTHTVHSQ